MFIKRIIFGIFISLFFSLHSFSEELTHGVLFRSSAEPINNRTSLSIFDEKLQKFEDTFSISFDLSIWDIKQFGYILRVVNDENQEIDFVFVNFRGEDDLYLDFHSPITHRSVPIPINKNDLYERRWLPLRITFDLKADKASIHFKDTTYTCNPIGLKNPSKLKFVYGLYGLNLDVPQMLVRNIKIEKNGKLAYTFPLNESKGEWIHDTEGEKMGTVKNPEWIINRHYYWQERKSFNTSSLAAVTYDPGKNRILIFDKDFVSIYLPQYETDKKVRIENFPLKGSARDVIYSPKEDKSFIYSFGNKDTNSVSPSFAVVDMNDYSVKSGNPVMDGELFHHNVFLGADGATPYIFGGLKKYTYSNKIYYYNSAQDSWDELAFSGDTIRPRFFAAAGEGLSPSQVLIMGGFGNESGKLEHGGRHLYDLFSVDLDKKEIKKLWEIDAVSSGLVPCNNLILDRGKTCFYTLCYPHHQESAALQLYRFNLSDGSYQTVSDSIPIVDGKMNTAVYLFFSELMQEFYMVIKEYIDDNNSRIRIYSLLSTPVSAAELEISEKPSYGDLPYIIAIPFILGLLGWGLWFMLKRIKSEEKKQQPEEPASAKEQLPEITVKKENAIYVFGDFTVFDKKGMDISYRFSSKLKSLFALILFNSKEETGISTEKMTMELWPDKDNISAKNTRGVTINRLRSILADMEGITLVHQNSKWFFSFDNSFFCDFVECEAVVDRLYQQVKNRDEGMYQLLHILRRGALFPSLQESWIDTFKRDFENKTEKVLSEYIVQLYENRKYAQLIHYSELYFMIDPLNEDVIDLCLKALQKIGKTEQALSLYNKFVSNYRDSMGEEPRYHFPI